MSARLEIERSIYRQQFKGIRSGTQDYLRSMGDEELDRIAAEELLHEAGRGKERASTMGTYGWKKRQVSTNKVFLKNTLRGVISGNRHRSSSRVEKRHKDGVKRTDTNFYCKDENKSRKLYRGSHDRREGTSQERDKRTPGHSSRRDDFHSKESCSQKNSKSSGGREKNDRYHRSIFCKDESCSHDKGKECKTTSRKCTLTKEK